MLLSILIVNYNGLKHLEECLGSIYSQVFDDYEVVMVDNASRDGSVDFVTRHFPSVRIVPSPVNTGFAGGNNLGVRHCRGDYVFLLNNDTRLDKDALGSLARAIREHPRNRVFACFLIDYQRPHLADSAGDTLYTVGRPFSFAGFPISRFTEPRPVTCACAGAAVYAKPLMERLGGFDEDFFLIFEDMDLSLRARHDGEDILFLPSVRVFHKGSASLGGKLSKLTIYYSERNFLPLLLKNFPLPSLLRILPGYLFLKVLRFFHAARANCLGAYFKGNIHALGRIPSALSGRRRILGESRLTPSEFQALLRRSWLKERLAMARGDFDFPI